MSEKPAKAPARQAGARDVALRAGDLASQLEAVQQREKARRAELDRQIEAGQQRPRQMALFPEDARAIPNYLARTPLFAPVRPGRRRQRDGELLASPKGFEIRFSGVQLDQSDCDVFMQLVHEARGKTLGDALVLNRADFLSQIGRADGGKNYEWLANVFRRLNGARIHVESERYRVNMTLLTKTIEDKQTGAFSVVLDPDIVKMFSGAEYSLVDWQKRKQLERRVDLAKWLHNFICSHEHGLQRWTVGNLREWSGYASPLRKFREALAEALGELERVEIIRGTAFYERESKVRWTRL